jgi:histidine phosphotransferase ChpT
MSGSALSDLELAALLSSRICHDVISPVGAIANGLELLAEEADETMRDSAMDLIRRSAAQASAKLQFARLAFGAAGSAGAEIDLRDAEHVARGIMDPAKHRLQWSGPAANLPKDRVKLLLNMISLAISALPRGGTIDVTIEGSGDALSFRLLCQGDSARVPEGVPELIAGGNGHALDAHSIQPYYAGRIAGAAGMTLDAVKEGADVLLRAAPPR